MLFLFIAAGEGSLEKTPTGGLYRFESLSSGFQGAFPLDGDGSVLDYPGVFRRVGTW